MIDHFEDMHDPKCGLWIQFDGEAASICCFNNNNETSTIADLSPQETKRLRDVLNAKTA
jgi:hypothetical protein